MGNEDETRTAQHHRVKLIKCSRDLVWLLETGGPKLIAKLTWERILEHGSELFGETIYSVGADTTLNTKHQENEG